MRFRRRTALDPLRSATVMFCCSVYLSAFLPETTSHEDRRENSIQRTTAKTSADHRDELISVATKWRHSFYGLKGAKGNSVKETEWRDNIADNARGENDETISYSGRRDVSIQPGERIASQEKNILEGYVFPRSLKTGYVFPRRLKTGYVFPRRSKTANRNATVFRLNVDEKGFPDNSDQGKRKPDVLSRFTGRGAVGKRRPRLRRRDTSSSIEDGTLEDLFGDALIFSEREIDSDLKKSMVGVGAEADDDQLNYDEDQEAMEAAEEETLEKRDANDVAITNTMIKEMEDTIFNRALLYVNQLEPNKTAPIALNASQTNSSTGSVSGPLPMGALPVAMSEEQKKKEKEKKEKDEKEKKEKEEKEKKEKEEKEKKEKKEKEEKEKKEKEEKEKKEKKDKEDKEKKDKEEKEKKEKKDKEDKEKKEKEEKEKKEKEEKEKKEKKKKEEKNGQSRLKKSKAIKEKRKKAYQLKKAKVGYEKNRKKEVIQVKRKRKRKEKVKKKTEIRKKKERKKRRNKIKRKTRKQKKRH